MNLVLPVALAVLLAEGGGPLARSIAARHWLALVMALLTIVAAAMIVRSRDMMLAIALFFAAFAQVTRDRHQAAPTTSWRALVAASRAATPLLVMTLAMRYVAPVAAAGGAMLGLAGASVVARQLPDANPRWRIAAGVVLGIATLVYALRVVRPT
jgi:dolichyl-phosphate-mannose--protein O-mannosyl transferase